MTQKLKKNEQKKHTLTTRPVLQGACELARAQQRQQHQEKKKYSQKAITNDNTCTSSKVPRTESSQQVMPAQKVTALDQHTRTHVDQQQTSLAL